MEMTSKHAWTYNNGPMEDACFVAYLEHYRQNISVRNTRMRFKFASSKVSV